MIFLKGLSRTGFFVFCVLYYVILFGYFNLIMFSFELEQQSKPLLQYLCLFAIFLLTVVLVKRVDLLWVRFDLHQKMFDDLKNKSLISKPESFSSALMVYIILIATPLILYYFKGRINTLAFYYLFFLYGTIIFHKLDFLFPGHSRSKQD